LALALTTQYLLAIVAINKLPLNIVQYLQQSTSQTGLHHRQHKESNH